MKHMSIILVMLGASVGHATAGTVWINPNASQFTSLRTTSARLSAQVSFADDRMDMHLSPGDGAAAQTLSKRVADTRAAASESWDFELSYSTTGGYSFTLSQNGGLRSRTLSWLGVHVADETGLAVQASGDTAGGPTPGSLSSGQINYLRLHAMAAGAGQELTFSNLSLQGPETSGAFDAGTVSLLAGEHASIEGVAQRGSNYQEVVSSYDLSQSSWVLGGRVQSNGINGATTPCFGIDVLDVSYSMSSVPLPSGAACAIAGLAAVAAIQRRRRHSSARAV